MEQESSIYLLILKKNCMFCNISLRKSLKFASLFKISMTTSAKSNRMLIVDGMKNSLLQQSFYLQFYDIALLHVNVPHFRHEADEIYASFMSM